MNQSLIWDYYQTETPELFAGSVARLCYLANKAKPKGRVLNIGVGGGVFEKVALNRGFDVYSVDPSESAIVSIRKRLGMGDKAKVGYSYEIPFPDHFFDAVVVSEVIEHLSDVEIEQTLKEIARVLTVGGRVIGTVPANENIKDQLVVCPCCGEHFHRWGHIQSFDLKRITALLSPYFHIVEVFQRPFCYWSGINWKGKAIGVVKMLLYYCGVHGSNENILFVAKRKKL